MLEKVAVIDKKIAKKVFNNQAMGQSIYINGEGFKVVGVSESSEVDESGMPIESLIQIPSKTFNKYMGNLTQGMPQLLVTVEKGSDKKDVGKKGRKSVE